MPEPTPPHPLIASGGALLAILSLLALAAPWVATSDPYEMHDVLAGRLLPPASERLEIRLVDGRILLAEDAVSEGAVLRFDRLGRSQTIPLALIVNLDANGRPEARRFLLGTDRFGRDLWSRLVFGARVSLKIGMLAAGMSLALGTLIGAVAGLAGGLPDFVLMRLTEAMLAFPRLFLILTVVALVDARETAVILILGATSWMTASRLVRAEVRSLRRQDFVLAARATGQSPARVFSRHLIPNAVAPVLVQTALRVGDLILLEAALSFLSFGVQPPTPSWGNIIFEGSDHLLHAWWLALFPGLALVLTVVAFNLLADGVRDALDPRSNGRRLAAR